MALLPLLTRLEPTRIRRIGLSLVGGSLLALTLAGCLDSHAAVNGRHVVALTLREARTPALRAPGYRTSGTFPQFNGSTASLGRVNAAIRDVVVKAEAPYARWARAQLVEFAKIGIVPLGGSYSTATDRRFISASSELISVLIPETTQISGGPDGARWLSLTMRVPSGDSVSIDQLFTNPAAAFRAVSGKVRAFLASNDCYRSTEMYFRSGLSPTTVSFQRFALTVRGVVFGFGAGQIAAPPCGAFRATVPFNVVRPYLSQTGRDSIVLLRQPR